MRFYNILFFLFGLLVINNFKIQAQNKIEFVFSIDDFNQREIQNCKNIVKFPVKSGVEISDLNIINLQSKELAEDYEDIEDFIDYYLVEERGESYVEVVFNAFQSQGDKVVFRNKIQVEYTLKKGLQSRNRSGFVAESILKSGDWFKFDIQSTGVYSISNSWLKSNSINIDGVSLAQINIFGYEGGMLPEDNSIARPDDLPVIPSRILDKNNNLVFDANDEILFYAQSPDSWELKDSVFKMNKNVYATKSTYFLGVSSGLTRASIADQQESTTLPNNFVSTYQDYKRYEEEEYNVIKSGRQWFGDKFDSDQTKTFVFNFKNRVISKPVYIEGNFMSRSVGGSSSFSVSANSNFLYNVVINPVTGNYTSRYGNLRSQVFNGTLPGNSNLNIQVSYNQHNPDAEGYIDYIEVNSICNLKFTGSQLSFRNLECIAQGNVSEFTIENTIDSRVWEVTDFYNPKNQTFRLGDNDIKFVLETEKLKEFIVFDINTLSSPLSISRVSNQNLHALQGYNYIIISHPNFISTANQIAAFHQAKGLSTHVVTPQQIYNEFSSGRQDITGFKFFLKMFYERYGTENSNSLKYVLLLGDASYDMRNILSDNTNFIPSFQSQESLSPTSSYVSDDYFGLLGDNESSSVSDKVDLGIGRFPVQTNQQASQIFEKTKRYYNSLTYNNWRNVVAFVADDEDNNRHLSDSEKLSDKVSAMNHSFNIDKLYADSYTQISTAGGTRIPDLNTAIYNRVQKGALIVNYIGHGGELGWGHERFLDVPTIQSWTNQNLPLFVTATCEFSRFDDPARVSAGEYVILNPDGGGVLLLTTTRLVYSSSNYELNNKFYDFIFEVNDGKSLTIGEVLMLTKNNVSPSVNKRNFSLLGDPAIRIGFGENSVMATSVNSKPLGTDTIKALDKITIRGEVRGVNNQLLSDFNGEVYPTIYDKSVEYVTLGQDAGSFPQAYELQNSKLFNGKATVSNGRFEFSFIVPKDMNYSFGKGKISFYAKSNAYTAKGFDTTIVVGGESDSAYTDKKGPEISLYMNDENFINGGLTDSYPLFIAELFDENGINSSGNSIGHDLSIIKNDELNTPILVNEFYQADLDSYQSGKVEYPFSNLEDGDYTLQFKAWDTHNNSSEESIDFVVKNAEDFQIENVLNYPNPFINSTDFMFTHNQVNQLLEIQIQIYTISGRVVKNIQTSFSTNGTQSPSINWDGKDDFGDQLAKGVYIYKLTVKNENKQVQEKIEKLVLLK